MSVRILSFARSPVSVTVADDKASRSTIRTEKVLRCSAAGMQHRSTVQQPSVSGRHQVYSARRNFGGGAGASILFKDHSRFSTGRANRIPRAAITPQRKPLAKAHRVRADSSRESLIAEESPDEIVARNIAGAVAVVLLLIGAAAVYRDPLAIIVENFAMTVADMGPTGYLIYMTAYVFLEVVAIPSFPLAWGAVIFGQIGGGAMIVVSATLSATLAFLFSRYIGREKILPIAEKNSAFSSVNRALDKDAFRIVFLLRLSPVIPGAIANYFYGVTSVELAPYIFGTALGEVPGAYASILAGTVGQSLTGTSDGGQVDTYLLVAGVIATVAGLALIGEVATKELQADIPGVVDANTKELSKDGKEEGLFSLFTGRSKNK